MTIVHIDNVGSQGIIQDTKPYDLPVEAWSSGQNIRFTENAAEKFKGQESIFGTPGAAPHWLLPWQVPTEFRWIYPSTDKIYYTNGLSHTDITRYSVTPGDNDYTAGTRPIWSGGVLHGVPILNHTNLTDFPQQWDGNIARMRDLSNWPAATYAKVIRPFKNRLIAMNIVEGVTTYPHMIRWSTSADPGSVPSTWDYTLATNDSGRATLAETNGQVLDSLSLSNANIIYKDDSIWRMSEIGGIFVFRFDLVSETLGILAPRCVKEFYKRHLLVGADDIVLFDGNKLDSIVNGRMRKWFFNNLSGVHYDKTVITPNYAEREMWISFVEAGSTSEYLTKALIWNWSENSWTVRDLPDIAHLGYGQVGGTTVETYDGSSGAFNADFGAFGASQFNPAEQQLLFAKAYTTNEFMQGDVNYTDRGTSYTAFLERTGLAIAGVDRQGRPKVDQASVKFVRSVFPKISAQNPVSITVRVGSQNNPSEAVTWCPPQIFNTATDTKVDCEVTGKYIAIRFEETSSEPWDMSGYALDIDVVSML
jgi:hypothetical protein